MSSIERNVIAGPWLLEWRQLEDLDRLLLQLQERLKDREEQKLQEEFNESFTRRTEHLNDLYKDELADKASKAKAEETIQKRTSEIRDELSKGLVPKSVYKVELTLGKSNKVKADSISELAEKNLGSGIPRQLTATIEVRGGLGNSSSISVTFTADGDLEIRTYSYASEISESISYRLRDWAMENKPSMVQQFWLKLSRWPILPGIAIFWIPISGAIFSKTKDPLKAKALELLSSSSKTFDQEETLKILLQRQFDLVPLQTQTSIGWYISLIVTFLLIVLVHNPPKLAIGLGNGKGRVRFSRAYVKVVTVSVPMLVLTGMFIPILRDWIKSL